MWGWMIGVLALAAMVNQIVIALCRGAQVATEQNGHQQCSGEP
jgi:hypothetical protein